MAEREYLFRGARWVYYFGAIFLGGGIAFAADWPWWAGGLLALGFGWTSEGLDALVRRLWLRGKPSSPAHFSGEEGP